MSAFSKALAFYIDTMANPKSGINDEYMAAELLCVAIETKAQAQIAFDSMDDASRIMGNHVSDNADDSAYHPEESEGMAYVTLQDGFAILTQWDNYGFWEIDFVTIAEAETAIEEYNARFAPEEEEESED